MSHHGFPSVELVAADLEIFQATRAGQVVEILQSAIEENGGKGGWVDALLLLKELAVSQSGGHVSLGSSFCSQ